MKISSWKHKVEHVLHLKTVGKRLFDLLVFGKNMGSCLPTLEYTILSLLIILALLSKLGAKSDLIQLIIVFYICTSAN